MLDASQLIEQLRSPDGPLDWADAPAGETPQIELMLMEGTYALVVPVLLTPDGKVTVLSPEGPGRLIRLVQLSRAEGRQTVPAGHISTGASHVLVMGWIRHRPAQPPWARIFFDHPFDATSINPDLFAVLTTPAALQKAIDHIGKASPKSIAASLLQLPEPEASKPTNTSDRSELVAHAFTRASDGATAARTTDGGARLRQLAFLAAPASQSLQATRMVFASCQYPAGLMDRQPASGSFRRLEAIASASRPLGALLLLGDLIYTDATYGILDPSIKTDPLTLTYQDLLKSLKQYPSVDALRLEKETRLYVTPDDHEIRDNWEPSAFAGSHSDVESALRIFGDMRPSNQPKKQPDEGYWGHVAVGGGHRVFMLDTRITRVPRPWGPGAPPSQPQPHIVSHAQIEALETWLLTRKAEDGDGPVTPKFISSSVWLLPRRVGRAKEPDDAAALSDSWDGYPASLKWLLGFIAAQDIRGVVMLCGDAHLAGHTRVDLKLQDVPVRLDVLHAPALYAPFPFANGQPHHYRQKDGWRWFTEAGEVSCDVQSDLWPLGDGFVDVSVALVGEAWQIQAHFDTQPVPGPTITWTV